MRKFIFGLFIVMLVASSHAQNVTNFENIKLETREDYNPAANAAALQASNFLLLTPLDANNVDRLKALQYIIRWMTGTPDYSFELDAQATKFAKKNDDLLGLYMAAMTKFVLENKADSKDQDKIKLNAVRLIIEYAREPKNKVKPNKELKKAMEAEEKGQLTEYLKM